MKNINLIPDGNGQYISTKIFNLHGHHFHICTSVDGSFPYISTSADDADITLQSNEIFECVDQLFQINAIGDIDRVIQEAKVYRREAIKAATGCRLFYVGIPSPSGHDVNYIKVTKVAMLRQLRSTETDEWNKAEANNGGTHYWIGQDGKTFYWN